MATITSIVPNVADASGGTSFTITITGPFLDFDGTVVVSFNSVQGPTNTTGNATVVAGITTVVVPDTGPYFPGAYVSQVVDVTVTGFVPVACTFIATGEGMLTFVYAAPVPPRRTSASPSLAFACNFQQCVCYNKCRKHQDHSACNKCKKIHRCPICF